MERQYIGARYVPKFFEYNNGNWSENTEYEPLTIVQYNGNSYTSKKPVPSNVGNPSSNPDYWVSTGNYNAQVEAYRREVQDVINSIDKNNVFNMYDEGADITGITPCDSVLESAIASGKTIYFPKGTYLFAEQHTFRDVDVIGKHATIHTRSLGLSRGVMNEYGGFNSTYEQMVFRLKQNVNLSGFIFDRLDSGALVIEGDNVIVKECYISTYATISGSTGYYGIVVRNCSNVHISNITIQMDDGNNRDGIHIESNSHNIYISNCELYAGDDGIALNALEGTGGNIYNVFINNCYIGGYGMRFFGCKETQVFHVEVNNCTIEVTSPNMQSASVRFSNSTNTIGGTPIGNDGYFSDINFNNCDLIGNRSVNSAIYCYHAYVGVRLSNCVLYSPVYYDESVKDTHIHFANCLLNEIINVRPNNFFTSIELCECDVKGIYKEGNGNFVLTATDVNISDGLSVTGISADYIKLSNCFISPVGVVLNTNGGTFNINNTRVQPLFNLEAGTGANYFISNLIGHGGVNVITSASNASRICCDCMVDSLPSAPVNTDHVFIGNLLKYYLAGEWLSVNMTH